MAEQKKILVVEDEAVVLHTLQLILRHNGYEVRGARDGSEALAIVAAFRPDILLCDINLPDMNGIQVSLSVKTSVPECRVVLLSGEITTTELLENAEKEGYHFEVVAKPTDPEQLLRVLAGDESGPGPGKIHRVK
jgi:CheY-like chemotaxis protein